MENRLDLLKQYRDEREKKLPNTGNGYDAGEANGRNYSGPTEQHKTNIPPGRFTPSLFADTFEKMMARYPVEIRKGELIVGDYYEQMFDYFSQPPGYNQGGTQVFHPCGHTAINAEEALRLGWDGIRKKIQVSREHWENQGDKERGEYLGALDRVAQSIQNRIGAYAAHALMLAQRSADAQEQQELLAIQQICTHIQSNPPSSLREALQWYWLYVTAERSTSCGQGGTRLDQVFYPYYQQDRALGRITEAQTLELIAALLLKEGLFYSIGGQTPDGQDACNDLTRLALEAYDTIGGPSNLNLRWHPGLPGDVLDKTVYILGKHRSGVPAIVNDSVIVPSLEHYAFSPQDARNYNFSGCFWYVVPGQEYPYHDMEAIYATEVLVLALRRARKEQPKTFESFFALFLDEQKKAMDTFEAVLGGIDQIASKYYQEMVVSLCMDGCIERGKDVTNSGTLRSMTTVLYVGLATVADSLQAIRQLLYEEKTTTWEQLCASLDENFAGDELLRQRLLKAEKFGNNLPQADALTVRLANEFKALLRGRKNAKGEPYRPAFYSWNRHTYEAVNLQATPDGRLRGTPFSQGVNPTQGQAHEGLTAVIHSVGKIDFSDCAGAPLHIHLSPIADPQATYTAVKSLVLTSFGMGIPQVNVNFTDQALLQKAMAQPEAHWDLVIRITGYSARFVQLGTALQREVMERNVF